MNKIKAGTAVGVAISGLGLLALATPAQAAEACQPSKAYDSTSVVTPASVKHHDALTHNITVHHEAETHVVHHDEVSHVVHHDAVTHIVHHDAVTHEVTVVDQEAWDETVVDQQAYDETIPGQHHDAVTHVEHVPAVTHVVHHDAVQQVQYEYVKQAKQRNSWVDQPQYLFIDWTPNVQTTFSEPGIGTYHMSSSSQHDGDTSNVINFDGTQYRVIVHVRTVVLTPAWDETVVDTPAHDVTVVDKAAYDDPPTVVHHDAVTHTVHHDAITHQETVVDQAAWDETVVDEQAWDETVVDTPAWDETVVDKPAYDETVTITDKQAWDQKVPAVTKTVHHAGVTCSAVVVPKATPPAPPAQPEAVQLAASSGNLAETGTSVPLWLVTLALGGGLGVGGGLVAVGRWPRHRKAD